MEELYGDDCWPKKGQTRKERDQCFKTAQAGIRECETCNESEGGRCTRFAEVTPATTTFTPRHGHASVVFPYRADADSPAELADLRRRRAHGPVREVELPAHRQGWPTSGSTPSRRTTGSS